MGKVWDRYKELYKIKEDKDNGKVMCIPFESYPKLMKSVPGVIPGMIQMVTAGSGVGKTQWTKALYVREPLEYAMKNNIKLKIFYFALEESVGEFIDTMICNYVSQKAGIKMDVLMLQGYRDKSLTGKEMMVIENHVHNIEALLDNVEIIDSVYNPTGIYKYCRDYADKNGKHHFVDKEFIKKRKDGTTTTFKQKVYSHYEPNDPNAIVIVVVDHLSLLSSEKGEDGVVLSQHKVMAKWSTDYALKQITKHWNWAVVNVIQQEQSQESEQFTQRGESIQKKTEPSLAGFANNKEIQRDAKVIVGVYSPDRHGFEDYHGYDVRRFRDTIRGVKILKNRFGPPNKYHHFLFDGARNLFAELPAASETSMLQKFLDTADVLLGRTKKP